MARNGVDTPAPPCACGSFARDARLPEPAWIVILCRFTFMIGQNTLSSVTALMNSWKSI
jgi:hypothetical protein